MIVVTVTLHSAVTGGKIVLGETIIHNVGGTRERGDYAVCVGRKTQVGDLRRILLNPLRKGAVDSYPRLSYNVWRLVIRALRSAFPEEK
jgi:hypothetical protein